MSDKYILKRDAITAACKGFCHPGVRCPDEPCREQTKYLRELPPADVVQVRHGKWKKIGVWGRVYRCNQCGNFLDFDGVNAGRGDANFCPNCGAKMDGEREEGE